MARKLKVFSMPAGFVNAVVAAPSQQAALKAWGVKENLFAGGRATVVTDPELIARALKTPGEIVRVPIGSEADILKATARPVIAKAAKSAPTAPTSAASMKRAHPAPPRKPDRSALDAAEAERVTAQERKARELGRLDDQLRKLQDQRAAREVALDEEIRSATTDRDRAARAYRAAGGKAKV